MPAIGDDWYAEKQKFLSGIYRVSGAEGFPDRNLTSYHVILVFAFRVCLPTYASIAAIFWPMSQPQVRQRPWELPGMLMG